MSKTAKHTPTPWTFDPENYGISREPGYGLLDSTESSLGVTVETRRVTGVPIDNAEANAEFIVRACNAHDELVKACEDAAHEMIEIVQFATLENTPLRNQEVVSIGNVIARLQEALEHAKGE